MQNYIFYNYSRLNSEEIKHEAHTHNSFELIFVYEATGTYHVEDKYYQINPYDLIITRPGVHHFIDLKENTNYERINILVEYNSSLAYQLKKYCKQFDIISCRNLKNIVSAFDRMKEYHDNLNSDDFSLLLNSLIIEIAVNTQFFIKDYINTPKNISPTISQALDYINNHLFEIENVQEISSALFISKNYLIALFKETLEITPMKYINNKRLVMAQKRLLKGEKPTKIYAECGFNNYVTFYKAYTNYFGHPPSDDIN